MTHAEFSHIIASLDELSPEQTRHLLRELDNKLAVAANSRGPAEDLLLGLMSDHAELMDQIVDDAMRRRDHQPWR